MTHLAFPKPARLDRDVKKWERRVSREKARTKAQRADDAAWRKISAEVCARDGNTCRICSCQTTKWGKGDPRLWGSAHHLVYRSAGGQDTLENLIWTCRRCHEAEHAHEITIAGAADALVVNGVSETRGR